MLVVAELLDRPMVLIFRVEGPGPAGFDDRGFSVSSRSAYSFYRYQYLRVRFFTAMNNGRVSALVFDPAYFGLEVGALLLMPMWWGINGVWWAAGC